MLLVLNLPLIGLWVRMIAIPYHLLFPITIVFCVISVFSVNNNTFDVYVMAIFGVVGYIFRKLDAEQPHATRLHSRADDGRVLAPHAAVLEG